MNTSSAHASTYDSLRNMPFDLGHPIRFGCSTAYPSVIPLMTEPPRSSKANPTINKPMASQVITSSLRAALGECGGSKPSHTEQ